MGYPVPLRICIMQHLHVRLKEHDERGIEKTKKPEDEGNYWSKIVSAEMDSVLIS